MEFITNNNTKIRNFEFVNEAVYEIYINGKYVNHRKFKGTINDVKVIGFVEIDTKKITEVTYELDRDTYFQEKTLNKDYKLQELEDKLQQWYENERFN